MTITQTKRILNESQIIHISRYGQYNNTKIQKQIGSDIWHIYVYILGDYVFICNAY